MGWSILPHGVVDGATSDMVEDAGLGLSTEGLRLDFIPLALRRRCSSFSKVTLAVAHAAARECNDLHNTRTVFASSYGESQITYDLLQDLAIGQQLSPMGFSLSVHNAGSGLYSIATNNKAFSTAIAAGKRTFLMGLCESLLTLSESDAATVLYVCSDDLVPPELLPDGAMQAQPYALAVLLGSQRVASARNLSVEVKQSRGKTAQDPEFHALACARWLQNTTPVLELEDGESTWTLSLDGDVAHLRRSACQV